MTNQSNPPKANEIEISLFGPGYGEAILIHIGNGQWIAIDSCSKDAKCVPLAYLDLLGVPVETAVRAIAASHWHDDHIRGLFELYERSRSCELYYPAAFEREAFLNFSQAYMSDDGTPQKNGTNEIGRIFRLALTSDREAVPTLFDKPFLKAGGLCQVTALSPSSQAYQRFIADITKLLPKKKTRKRRVSPLTHNDAAMVVQVTTPAGLVLLGSDLEEERHSDWTAIIANAKSFQGGSNVIKVAHHGSKNGHCDDLWDNHLDPEVIAILTPFKLGRHSLPRKSDIERILKRSTQAFSTAPMATKSVKRSPVVSQALAHARVYLRGLEPPTGHIRLRSINGQPWSVERFDGALPLSQAYSSARPKPRVNAGKAKGRRKPQTRGPAARKKRH